MWRMIKTNYPTNCRTKKFRSCSTEYTYIDCVYTANDRKAQKSLYRRFYSFSMITALRSARDKMDAADIMSHAFVKIFKLFRSQ